MQFTPSVISSSPLSVQTQYNKRKTFGLRRSKKVQMVVVLPHRAHWEASLLFNLCWIDPDSRFYLEVDSVIKHKMYNSSTIFTSLSAFRILWPRDPTWSHWWQSVMSTAKITGNQVVAMAICRRVAFPPQRYNSHHFCANRIIKAYLWHRCAYQCTLWRNTLQLLSNTVGDVIT